MNKLFFFLPFLVTTVLFVACDDDDNDDIVVITVDDAAEFVAASLTLNTYGAVSNMNYVSDQIIDLIDCNESESDTRMDTETSLNGNVTATFAISESYTRTCEGEAETITYDFSSDQTTTSDRLDTENGIAGAWTINGAEASSTVLTYNGTYSRGGLWTYKNQDDRIDDTSTSFIYNEVKANKDDGVIFEGTSTFSMDGTSTVYEPYSYEGEVTFQADNICIATFSTGEQYEIDLNSGDVTPL